MSITPSTSPEIRSLISSLSSDDDVKRESAVARLAIIGARAMDRLVAAYPEADHATRLALLRAAEAIADPRAIPISLKGLAEGGDLAIGAASTLRSLLNGPHADAAAQALDALVATTLDASVERRVRMAAFDALQDMPPAVRDRVAEALRNDADARIKAYAADAPRDAAATDVLWQDALDGQLPEDPALLLDAVKSRAAAAALSALQQLLETVRAREGAATSAARAEAWRRLRGALHQALALRGSRIALYDLRETLTEAADPLPASFLAALHVVGDESCLEPIAAAWTRAGGARASTEPLARWRHQLDAAFQAIVKRGRISWRSAAFKRVQARFPEAAQSFSTTSRTTPRPKTRGRT